MSKLPGFFSIHLYHSSYSSTLILFRYGCCKDNVTEAKGPKQKGCEPEPEEAETTTFAGTTETPESCSNSTYGCCPDGVKIAEGEYFKGCDIFKENCSDSYFGCCPDGKTSGKETKEWFL